MLGRVGRTAVPNEAMMEARIRSLTSESCQLMGIVKLCDVSALLQCYCLRGVLEWRPWCAVVLVDISIRLARGALPVPAENKVETLTSWSENVLCRWMQ